MVSIPHPMWQAVDRADPPALRRPYWDRTPAGDDHPIAIADLFTSLVRAGFRVDTVLEPQPAPGASRSRWWQPAMAWLPSTLVVRGRKVGT